MTTELLLAIVTTAALLVASVAGLVAGPAVPVASVAGLLMLAAAPLLVRSARRRVGARGAGGVALTLAVLSFLALVGCNMALTTPLFQSYLSPPDDVTALEGTVVLLAASWVVAKVVLGERILFGRELLPAVRVWSRLALVVTGALLAGSLARAFRLPDVDHVRQVASEHRSFQLASGRPTESERGVDVYQDEVGGALVRRRCLARSCAIAVQRADLPPEPRLLEESTFVGERDDQLDLLVFPDALVLDLQRWRGVYVGPGFERGVVSVARLAPRLSPPRGWIAGAAIGVLLSLGALALRLRRGGDLARIAAGREGTTDDAGFLRFPDSDEVLRVPEGWNKPAGPCLVLDLEAHAAARDAYRGEAIPRAQRVLAGSKVDLLEDARVPLFNLDAFILAASSLLGAPLLAALFHGLVL